MLIPKRLFAISRVCSKDATRPNLSAVFAEREPGGRPRVTATDGHALVTVTWPEPDHQDFTDLAELKVQQAEGFTALVPVTTWNEAGKNLAAKGGTLAIARCALLEEASDGERLRLTSTDGDTYRTVSARPPVESFPDYRIFFPATDRVQVRIGLSSVLLSGVLDTMTAMAGRNVAVEVLVPADAGSPVELRARGDNDEEIRALCMPVRLVEDSPSPADSQAEELRVVLSQLERLVSHEDFHRRKDLQTLVKNALGQLTATVAEAAGPCAPLTCERCQRGVTEIGDCGYCPDCCTNACTHGQCDCFAPQRHRINVLLIGEFEVDGRNPLVDAATQLDAFREAVQPATEYGISLYQATTADLARLAGSLWYRVEPADEKPLAAEGVQPAGQ